MATKIVDEHIFDSFLNEPDIDEWAGMSPSFPDVMREQLHFEMDGFESYEKLFPIRPYNLPELEQYEIILKNLSTVSTKVYGNFVLSEWRRLTYWSCGFKEEAAFYFFQHALPSLIEKMNSYDLVMLESEPYPTKLNKDSQADRNKNHNHPEEYE